jgi:hypothetical protein
MEKKEYLQYNKRKIRNRFKNNNFLFWPGNFIQNDTNFNINELTDRKYIFFLVPSMGSRRK